MTKLVWPWVWIIGYSRDLHLQAHSINLLRECYVPLTRWRSKVPNFCFLTFVPNIRWKDHIFGRRSFLNNYIVPLFLELFVNLLKIVNFTRDIARIRMRPFQLQSGEKYRILQRRKVDFTSWDFAILASLVPQILLLVKIAYFTPL